MKRRIGIVLTAVLMCCITALPACRFKNPYPYQYQAVFDDQLHSRQLFDDDEYDYYFGTVFIIKTKADFDKLFNEERKALYNTPMTNINPPRSFDFDTNVPYGATDFETKMLILYVFKDGFSGVSYKLKNIELTDKLLCIDYTSADPEGTKYPDVSCTRCFVVTLDRLDIDTAEFRQLRKVDGEWSVVR